VAFDDDDDRETRQALLSVVSWVGFFARIPKERQLLVKNDIILAFEHAIAVDRGILRVSAFVAVAQRQSRDLSRPSRLETISSRAVWIFSCRPSREPCVYRSHDFRYTWGSWVTSMPTTMVLPSWIMPSFELSKS